jgi:hypothetical protein
MLTAFRTLHPTLGAGLDTLVGGLDTENEKADAFLAEFQRSKTSKGEFAQELAGLLDESLSNPKVKAIPSDCVPEYIRDALEFLGVINNQNVNVPD